ncbi:MAG TPA: CDP-archaeol synthase [Pirellulaceae bacterium]|jgi:phosphatidate cytidylyltransferase
MKNDSLSARLLSAAVILATLLTVMWLDYRLVFFGVEGVWLLPVLLVVAILATEEMLSLLRAQGHDPRACVVYVGNVLLPLAASWSILRQLLGTAVGANFVAAACVFATLGVLTLVVFLGEMGRYDKAGTASVNAALALFTLVYIGVCISFWSLLRLFHGNGIGMTALFSMLLMVKVADTGAFICGKCFGRHKMTPILSPGKTWEGAIGGILVACVTSWAFFQFAAPAIVGSSWRQPAVAATIAYGVALALAGMIGDLAESMLKRDMQRKDSSTWLPGLGGVLDIIDAPLLAGPIAWLCWNLGLFGN